MSRPLITALICLSSIGLFSCSNESKVSEAEKEKPSQVKPNLEAEKQLKIYTEAALIDMDFAKWVNVQLNKDPDLVYSLLGKNSIYTQIAHACILSGDLRFKEVVAPHIYKFEPTEQIKSCLLKEIKKPTKYQILGQSFLVPVGAIKNIELDNKLKQIFEQADKKGIFTVEDYMNIASLLFEDIHKKSANAEPEIKKPA